MVQQEPLEADDEEDAARAIALALVAAAAALSSVSHFRWVGEWKSEKQKVGVVACVFYVVYGTPQHPPGS